MHWVNQITYSGQMSRDLRQAVYVVRGDRLGLPQAVAQAVARQDPGIERVSLEPMSAVGQRNLGSSSLAIRLIGTFGGLALLTTVGIYVIVSVRAAERSREMAIRLARRHGVEDPQAGVGTRTLDCSGRKYGRHCGSLVGSLAPRRKN